jgi:hypothetical protein
MKTKLLLGVVLLAILVGIAIWRRPDNTPPGALPRTNATSDEGIRKAAGKGNREVGMPPQREPINIPKMLQIEREREIERGKDQWRTPIEFYGKVVDELNQPLPGAEVTLGCNDLSISGHSTYKTNTDGTGSFSIRDISGKTLTVSVAKPGYYTSKLDRTGFFYAGKNENFVPSPNNPVIYHLWKKGATEPLIVLRGGYNVPGEGKQYSLPRDGTPTEIDLASGRKTAPGQGNLVIECFVDDAVTQRGAKFDWSCRLTVPKGGILLSTNEFDFIALESGYTPSAEIEARASDENWQRSLTRKYFLHLPDGHYARMIFSINAWENPFCEIEAFVNPSGSRNLEYDPNKSTPAH